MIPLNVLTDPNIAITLPIPIFQASCEAVSLQSQPIWSTGSLNNLLTYSYRKGSTVVNYRQVNVGSWRLKQRI